MEQTNVIEKDVAALADNIEQFMYNCGEYEYAPESTVIWITNENRTQTYDLIRDEISREETDGLKDYMKEQTDMLNHHGYIEQANQAQELLQGIEVVETKQAASKSIDTTMEKFNANLDAGYYNLKKGINDAVIKVTETYDKAVGLTNTTIEKIDAARIWLLDSIKDAYNNVKEFLKEAFKTAKNFVIDNITTAGAKISEIATKASEKFMDAVGKIKDVGECFAKFGKAIAEAAKVFAKDINEELFHGKSPVAEAKKAIDDGMKKFGESVNATVKKFGDKVNEASEKVIVDFATYKYDKATAKAEKYDKILKDRTKKVPEPELG